MSNKIWVLTYTIGTNEGRKSLRLICDTKEQAIMQQTVLGGEVAEYIRQQESLKVNWPDKIDIDEGIEKEEKSIAELESRTVAVKLPDLRQIVSGDRYVWSDGVYNYIQDVKVVLAAMDREPVEEFASYISLYNSNAERHAIDFAKHLRERADKC